MWRVVAVDFYPPDTDLLVILLYSGISSSTLMVDPIGLNYLDIIKQTKILIRHFLSYRIETAGVLLTSFMFLKKWYWEDYYRVNRR